MRTRTRNGNRGAISLFAALAAAVVMGMTLYTMQTLSVIEAKQKRFRTERLMGFYANEIALAHVHQRIIKNMGPLSSLIDGLGDLTLDVNLPSIVNSVVPSTFTPDSYNLGDSINFKRTREYDPGVTTAEGPPNGMRFTFPTTSVAGRRVACGRRKFATDHEPQLCVVFKWDPPVVDLKAKVGALLLDTVATLLPLTPVRLVWTSAGAYPGGCRVTGSPTNELFNLDSVSLPGLLTTGLSLNTTYTLTCEGPGGTATDTLTIGIGSTPPTADLKINGGDGDVLNLSSSTTSVDIEWTSTGATSCTLNPTGQTGTSHTQSAFSISDDTTYTLHCTGPGGTASDTIQVTFQHDCAGFYYGGACWYNSAPGGNCITACQSHGGYDQATKNFAGSGGTDYQCAQVLNGLGQVSILGLNPIFNPACDVIATNQVGCGTLSILTLVSPWACRSFSNTTTPSASGNFVNVWYFTRACACDH